MESRRALLCAGAISAAALGCLALAGPADRADETLKGLSGVIIDVAELSPAAAASGLKQEHVYADIERRLAAAGIRVFKGSPQAMQPDWGCVSVQVQVVKSRDPDIALAACSVKVSLLQLARLWRDDPQAPAISASTWSVSYLGLSPAEGAENLVRHMALPDLIDQLIAAWRSSHPRR